MYCSTSSVKLTGLVTRRDEQKTRLPTALRLPLNYGRLDHKRRFCCEKEVFKELTSRVTAIRNNV
jgi:hypothetical protein